MGMYDIFLQISEIRTLEFFFYFADIYVRLLLGFCAGIYMRLLQRMIHAIILFIGALVFGDFDFRQILMERAWTYLHEIYPDLDAHWSAGFLFWSYIIHGAHSVGCENFYFFYFFWEKIWPSSMFVMVMSP